jgi:hypothetical protein
MLVHVLGLCLLIGRASHACIVSQAKENYAFRVFGMAMTFTTIGAASLYLLHSNASRPCRWVNSTGSIVELTTPRPLWILVGHSRRIGTSRSRAATASTSGVTR